MLGNPCSTATHDPVPIDLGEFVCTDEEYEIEDQSEDTMQYLFGVYYPVRIRDIFHEDRYQVIHKLGRGGLSTVWLAHDRRDGKDVALKILTSTENAAKEYKIHENIKQRVRDRSRLALCQDHFLLSRVDRNKTKRMYHVLVLPLYGPSLLTLWETNQGPLYDHIVLGNVVHGLKVDLSKMSTPEKYKLLGRPRKAKVWEECPETGEDLVIGESPAPADFPTKIIGSDVYLCDFGILIEADTSVRNRLQSQPGYCAPEHYHDMEPSFASDIWSNIVLFLYLYTGRRAFAYGPGFAGVLSSIVDGVGVLPREWKGRYAAHDKVDVKESWYGQGSQSKGKFSAFLDEHRPDISAGEKALVLSVIQQVFRPKPQDRATALELLENKYFNALMSIYRVQ